MQTAMFWWLHCDQMDISSVREECLTFLLSLGLYAGLVPSGMICRSNYSVVGDVCYAWSLGITTQHAT